MSQWGTVDAKFNVPSVENPELTNVLPLKPDVARLEYGQVMAPTRLNLYRATDTTTTMTMPTTTPTTTTTATTTTTTSSSS